MPEVSGSSGPTMVPYFGYRDAAAALEWPAAAFGFEGMREFSAPDGAVMHAEMSFGAGTIMPGRGRPSASGGSEITETSPTGHGTYVVVEDVDAHHERAKAAGARVVYGTRRYGIWDAEVSRPGPRGIRVELRDLQTFGLTTDIHRPFDEGRDLWRAR